MKHFTLKHFLAFFFSTIFAFDSNSQISGTNSVLNIAANSATTVDGGLIISKTGNITDINVQISGGYIAGASGDILSYTGSLPSGVTAAFNNSKGVLSFTGTTSASNWQTLLRTVTLKTTSASCFAAKRSVTFVLENKFYNLSNNHYYSIGPFNAWTDAKSQASSTTYFGKEGYLVTSTSQDENNFLFNIVASGDCWIGGSDDYQLINSAIGSTTYASQTLSDGQFYWITGPEKGLQFSSGNAWSGLSSVSGRYRNYSNGEPNDWPNISTIGEENYLQLKSNDGTWNDEDGLSTLISVIEYGDMPNDDLNNNIAHSTRNIFINSAASGTISGDVYVCTGSNSATVTLTPPSIGGTFSVTRWESSPDQYFSNPTAISNTTTSLSLTSLTQNAYYRAIVNTSSTPSCTNLPTSSAKVILNNANGTWTGNTSRDWTTSSNWCGSVPSITTDIIIPTGTQFKPTIFNGNTGICRNLEMKSGDSLTIIGTLQVAGSLNIDPNSTFHALASTAAVEFKGSSAQIIPSEITFIRNLTINNASGVTLETIENVGGVLTLTSGILYVKPGYELSMGSFSSVSGGSNSSHVNGRILKKGNNSSAAFIFPIGKNGKYAPCGISVPTVATEFSAEYFKNPFNPYDLSGLGSASGKEHWNINRSNGTSKIDITLYSYDSTFSGIKSNRRTATDLIVAHWNSGASYWEDLGGTRNVTNIGGLTMVKMNQVDAFSPFTIGSPNGLNPLPVKLISFVAIPDNVTKSVELKWETTSEENSKYFEIMHSVDFMKWSAIGKINAKGNNNQLNTYSFRHLNPSNVNHYKLKEVASNGDYSYSDIKLVRFNDLVDNVVTIYPNPSNGSITIANANEETNFEIVDITGKIIQTGNFNYSIEIQNLPKGIYIVKLVSEGFIQNEKIVIQ